MHILRQVNAALHNKLAPLFGAEYVQNEGHLFIIVGLIIYGASEHKKLMESLGARPGVSRNRVFPVLQTAGDVVREVVGDQARSMLEA